MSTAQEVAAAVGDLPETASPADIVARVTRAFERLGSPANAEGQARFMPGLDRAHGVSVPHLRALGKHVARVYRDDPDRCRDAARESWPCGSREHRLFAVFLLEQIKELTPAECWELGVGFLPGVRTWEDCDQLCGATLGRALAAEPAYMDDLEAWVGDESAWARRAALVSTVYLRRSRLADEVVRALDARALALCEALLDDPEPYVRKAVDWAVREVLGRHYSLGRAWLKDQSRRALSRTARGTLKKSAKKLNEADRQALLAALG